MKVAQDEKYHMSHTRDGIGYLSHENTNVDMWMAVIIFKTYQGTLCHRIDASSPTLPSSIYVITPTSGPFNV